MQFELVFIPSPGIGHIRSTTATAKLLINRDDRLSVTLIVIPPRFSGDVSPPTVKSNSRLRYIFLPNQSSQDPNQTYISYIESQKPLVKTAVAEIWTRRRRLAGIVVDMFCTPMIDIAEDFGLPAYVYFTSNATYLGLYLHVQYLQDEENFNVTELINSDAELDVPTLTRRFPAKCLPTVMLEWFHIILGQTRRFKEFKGILVNSFVELEPQAMKFLSGGDHPLQTVYPVGPILDLKINDQNSVDDKQSEVLLWLDEQPRKSVVFLCFGSMGGFREEQAKEIAIALERSGQRFLWSLRRANPKGTIGPPGEFPNLEEILPEGFLERTAEIGKVIGWAPQTAVLANPAIGGFVSHCGWNSTLESLWFGVPIATWPLYAEQQVNAFELVEELGLAVEVRNSFRNDFMALADDQNELMKAEEIERAILCLMEKDSNVRDRVKEIREKSHVALMNGSGSSHEVLLKFIQDVTKNIS
ncbi:unnamed protein product [Cochlearia groenlandica]